MLGDILYVQLYLSLILFPASFHIASSVFAYMICTLTSKNNCSLNFPTSQHPMLREANMLITYLGYVDPTNDQLAWHWCHSQL